MCCNDQRAARAVGHTWVRFHRLTHGRLSILLRAHHSPPMRFGSFLILHLLHLPTPSTLSSNNHLLLREQPPLRHTAPGSRKSSAPQTLTSRASPETRHSRLGARSSLLLLRGRLSTGELSLRQRVLHGPKIALQISRS